MITRYAMNGDTPTQMEEQGRPLTGTPLVWIDMEGPSLEECKQVSLEHNIPLAHLRAALDFHERPRTEYANDILLVLARTPIRNIPPHIAPFSTCPVTVILAPDLIITVCLKKKLAKELLQHPLRGAGDCMRTRMLLTLLFRTGSTFIDYLHEMDSMVETIEHTLQESMQNKELIKMLHLEKSLIYFLTALKGNQSMLEKLRAAKQPAASPECLELLDDVVIETKQATDTAEIFSQVMGSISDAFGAIVSNNLNKVMKVLTGLTIVFMIPSIIGALYGMNVPLPWQESAFAFAALCALCLGASLGVFYLLRKVDWM